MFGTRRYDAFVSYSHRDESLVKPMVEMLTLNERRVFWDRQLAPGERWEDIIRASIQHSNIFVLFWCCDTHASKEVAKEIALALERGKKIVPVRLCKAAMPLPLSEWQWIDLDTRVQHQCQAVDHTCPGAPFEATKPAGPSRTNQSRILLAVSLAASFVAATLVQFHPHQQRQSGQPTSQSSSLPEDGSDIVRRIRTRDGYATVTPPDGRHPGAI